MLKVLCVAANICFAILECFCSVSLYVRSCLFLHFITTMSFTYGTSSCGIMYIETGNRKQIE